MNRSAAHDRAAWAVGAAFLAFYAATASRGLQFADPGELQTVAILGGIPHPSGYPLWAALANLFTRIPLGVPEFRVTLFSAVCGAAALALLVRRLGEMDVRPAAAIAAAALLGVTHSFWRFSVRAEVYTLTVALAVVALGAVQAARAGRGGAAEAAATPAGERDRRTVPPRGGRARWAAFLLGLVMSVHLAFAPLVAVAGIALVLIEWRRASRNPWRLLALLACFVLGLTPYLLLVVLDAAGARANSLEMVRENVAFMGWKGPPLESPWQGVAWLATSRNHYPPEPLGFHPRSIAAQLPNCAAVLYLFELGPLAPLFMLAGWVRCLRRDRPLAFALAAAFALTVGFAAWIQFGALLHVFLVPALVVGALLMAHGFEALLAAGPLRTLRPASAALLIGSVAILLAAAPLGLRIHAERHPIGPRGWRALDEDREFTRGLLPAWGGDPGARPWADSALSRFPRESLVLASWTYYTPLQHLRLVEGRRPDLTLRQIQVGTLAPRVRAWQREHDPALAPVVMVSDRPRIAALIPAADSLPLPGGRYAYVIRRAVPDSLLARIEPGR